MDDWYTSTLHELSEQLKKATLESLKNASENDPEETIAGKNPTAAI
jgi:hypothetical protein